MSREETQMKEVNIQSNVLLARCWMRTTLLSLHSLIATLPTKLSIDIASCVKRAHNSRELTCKVGFLIAEILLNHEHRSKKEEEETKAKTLTGPISWTGTEEQVTHHGDYCLDILFNNNLHGDESHCSEANLHSETNLQVVEGKEQDEHGNNAVIDVTKRIQQKQKIAQLWCTTLVEHMTTFDGASDWMKHIVPMCRNGYIVFKTVENKQHDVPLTRPNHHPSPSSGLHQCRCLTLSPSPLPSSAVPSKTTMTMIGLHKIGIVQSIYHEPYGTPRQGSLVPSSRGRLVLDKTISGAPDALVGLQEFSHVWIIFVFHKNTNHSYHPKVRPPRAKGRKLGALATRTPHRPNPIGLTVARIESIKDNIIYVSGIDLISGTPIIDIKPYHFGDYMANAKMPSWVSPLSTTTTKENKDSGNLQVEWTESAFVQLEQICTTEKLDFYTKNETKMVHDTINQILTNDPRSIHSRKNHRSIVDGKSGHTSGGIYGVLVDRLEVAFRVQESSANVIDVSYTPLTGYPLDRPRMNSATWYKQMQSIA